MRYSIVIGRLLCVTFLISSALFTASASEQGMDELKAWKAEFKEIVKDGEKNFNDEALSTNGLACGQCHFDAENTRPDTYPKFKSQLGKVVTIGQMINWCIVNPLEGKALALDSHKMVSLISYITEQKRERMSQ